MHLRVLDIQYLHECFNVELKIENKVCYIIALYRSPRQSQDEFEKFSEKLKLKLYSLLQNNPFLVVLIGDFNAKLKNWYKNDKQFQKEYYWECHNKRGFKRNVIENVTLQFGLQQVIKEPTYILDFLPSSLFIWSITL